MMRTKIYFLKVILLSAFFVVSCQPLLYTSPPPPPPPPAPEAMQVMNMPASVSQARQEFRNFRKAMGYVDGTGRSVDRTSGYFDINIQTLKTLYDEAANRGWSDIRIYNGIDDAGNPTLLVNGLQLRGSTLEEIGKADGDIIVKVENAIVGAGSGCPRWCDVTGTVIGK